MNPSLIIQSQLLATKFYVPTSPGTLIRRPRLHALLNESLKSPLTLISAPAGFGKTTLLSTWTESLPATKAQVAWLSLDEGENDPQLFWTYILSALDQQQPERFTPLFKSLQSPVPPLLMSVLAALIESVQRCTQPLVLILDDYHVITEQQVHATLWYLIDRLSPQLHLILATRVDPPLPLSLLRERRQVLEVRTEQLRCTAEETKAFLHEVMGTQLPDETVQEVTARTEGWLVGLQLLALSLPEQVEPLTLLEQVSGEQRYILDYLTEVVLQKQPPEVQRFLLCTSILERFNASLCDTVMEQTDSQAMLAHCEQSNLFVVSLDSRWQWYRYHALFAETLSHQLQQRHADLVSILHYRASRWYAEHHQTTAAILHAFKAKEWHWAADLIEGAYLPLISFAWGANSYALLQLRQWVEQLPIDIMACRPRLCLSCFQMLWSVTPQPLLYNWLDRAETMLRALLKRQTSADGSQLSLAPQVPQELENLLGEVLTNRAFLWCYTEEGHTALALCEQALALLSAENTIARVLVAISQLIAYYASLANDMPAAIKCGHQLLLLSQVVGEPAYISSMMSVCVLYMVGAGRLHEVKQLTQQAIELGTSSTGSKLPDVGSSAVLQAEILCEWNELDAARSLAIEGISLCEQATSLLSLTCLYIGHAILVHIFLSCGDLEAARSAFQQLERLGTSMNQPWCTHIRSLFTTIDQIRLWLACGELDRATFLVEQLDVMPQHLTPFARERQEVARARVLLAQDQPTAALQRLESALQRATAGQRWGHVLEIRLLQALAHQMLDEGPQALAALSEAICLGEPEGYIRSFVDEGTSMADLLRRLRQEQCQTGPTPYLDTLLAAFAKESKRPKRLPKQSRPRRLP